MDKRYFLLGGFFLVLLVGVLMIASSWTADRAVLAPVKTQVPETPGVPPMQR